MTALPQTQAILEAESLALGYGREIALRLPSLRVTGRRGAVIGLCGANGAGKSTFVKACLGLLLPSAGELRVLGERPGTRTFRTMLAKVGYVPQARPAGILRMTVGEVVECGRYGRIRFLGRKGEGDRRAIDAALERAPVGHLRGKAIQELSGGQFQRVQIARALASEPELLILDEPTSHLDAEGREDVETLVGDLARGASASLLLVSHEEELLSLSELILFFQGGTAELRDA